MLCKEARSAYIRTCYGREVSKGIRLIVIWRKREERRKERARWRYRREGRKREEKRGEGGGGGGEVVVRCGNGEAWLKQPVLPPPPPGLPLLYPSPVGILKECFQEYKGNGMWIIWNQMNPRLFVCSGLCPWCHCPACPAGPACFVCLPEFCWENGG